MNFTFTFTEHLVMGCVSTFSIATCIVALAIVILLGRCRYFMYRLATYQVIGALLVNIATALYLLQDFGLTNDKTIPCLVVAFVNVYFTWIKLLLTLGMTAHVFSYIICRKSLAYLEWFYVIFSVLFPLLYSWVPLATNNYGQAKLGCFIVTSNSTDGIIEEYSLFYGPLLFLMTLDFILIVGMAVYVWRRSLVHRASIMSSSLKNPYEGHRQGLVYFAPLLSYPTLFFFIILFPCVLSLLTIIKVTVNRWFALSAAVALCSTGWIAGLVLFVHLYCARAYVHMAVVPFEAEVQTPLIEDSERQPEGN